MGKYNKNLDELNNTELIKTMYNIIIEMNETLNNKNEKKIDKLSIMLENTQKEVSDMHKEIGNLNNKLNEHTKILNNHTEILDAHTENFEENDKRFESLEIKLDKISKNLDDLSRTEKLHFEYITNKFNRMEQKIDSNFKYLDEKIDNTKNKLVSEVTDEFESFSMATTKFIKNIEIDNIKGMDDYNKIILRNLESRISILEEETEKYTII